MQIHPYIREILCVLMYLESSNHKNISDSFLFVWSTEDSSHDKDWEVMTDPNCHPKVVLSQCQLKCCGDITVLTF